MRPCRLRVRCLAQGRQRLRQARPSMFAGCPIQPHHAPRHTPCFVLGGSCGAHGWHGVLRSNTEGARHIASRAFAATVAKGPPPFQGGPCPMLACTPPCRCACPRRRTHAPPTACRRGRRRGPTTSRLVGDGLSRLMAQYLCRYLTAPRWRRT